MKTVVLHGRKAAGRVALVDDEDYELVSQYRWHIRESVKRGRPIGFYAASRTSSSGGRVRAVLMHKLISGWPLTDHHDGDGLNNRRSNLRPATFAQNSANARKRSGTASQYKGIHWGYGKWRAAISKDGERRWLGTFDDEAAAALAYDAAARELFGTYARLNFPDESAGEVGACDQYPQPDSIAADRDACIPDSPGASRYRGVSWSGRSQKWVAGIKPGGGKSRRHLGTFACELEAAYAYDAAAREILGERAETNFAEGPTREMRDQWAAEREPAMRTCGYCGTGYRPRRANSRWCGAECKRVAERPKSRERMRRVHERKRRERLDRVDAA